MSGIQRLLTMSGPEVYAWYWSDTGCTSAVSVTGDTTGSLEASVPSIPYGDEGHQGIIRHTPKQKLCKTILLPLPFTFHTASQKPEHVNAA